MGNNEQNIASTPQATTIYQDLATGGRMSDSQKIYLYVACS